MSELLAAVNYAMADGMNVGDALNILYVGIIRAGPANDEIDSRAGVSERLGHSLLFAAFALKRDDRFSPDSLYRAASEASIRVLLYQAKVSGDQLKLDRRTSAVEDEDVHKSICAAGLPDRLD
jgi:hypothetical protein